MKSIAIPVCMSSVSYQQRMHGCSAPYPALLCQQRQEGKPWLDPHLHRRRNPAQSPRWWWGRCREVVCLGCRWWRGLEEKQHTPWHVIKRKLKGFSATGHKLQTFTHLLVIRLKRAQSPAALPRWAPGWRASCDPRTGYTGRWLSPSAEWRGGPGQGWETRSNCNTAQGDLEKTKKYGLLMNWKSD